MNLQQKLLSNSNIYLIVVQIVCTVLWFLPFMIGRGATDSVEINFLGETLLQYSPLTASIVQYFFVALLGIVITITLTKLKFTPLHSRFFYSIFFFSFSITEYAQLFNTQSVSFLFLLLAFYQLLMMFQSEAVFRAANSMVLLCIATLFSIEYVWFIPIFWIAFISLRAFTKNTFAASVFALATFAVILFSTAYITNNLPLIMDYFVISEKSKFLDFSNLQIKNVDIFGGILFSIFMLYYITVSFIHRLEQNHILRVYHAFSILIFCCTMAIYLINSNHFIEITTMLLFLNAFFGTYFYHFRQTKFSNILLIAFALLGTIYRMIWITTI